MMEIINYPERERWEEILVRPQKSKEVVERRVSEIIENVRREGDSALREMTIEYDGVTIDSFFVSPQEMDSAQLSVSKELKAAIDLAISNITLFHKAQIPKNIEVETQKGVCCYQRSLPVKRVGLYIPGGTAPLFSTVLMLGIPAKIAGCKEIALFTPPAKMVRFPLKSYM